MHANLPRLNFFSILMEEKLQGTTKNKRKKRTRLCLAKEKEQKRTKRRRFLLYEVAFVMTSSLLFSPSLASWEAKVAGFSVG